MPRALFPNHFTTTCLIDKRAPKVVTTTRVKRTTRVKPQSKLDALLDDIKDEIDALGALRSKKQCREGAKDLIEYIERHFLHRGNY